MPYDPNDLVPIARVTNTLVAVVVPASSPINSLADLVAAPRAQPGKLNWATARGVSERSLAEMRECVGRNRARHRLLARPR